jgi:putative nucleotidyltransferase with HDIG domain
MPPHSTSPSSDMVTQRLKLVLDEIRNVDPWPPVATRVLRISQQEDVVPSELVAVIQTDSGLTARVLKLCNSAFYGFQRQISSLPEAGNLLGVQALVNLVLTSCVQQEFRASKEFGNDRGRRLWERSVMNALAASLLASINGEVDRNKAYTAGLLQNIGHIVIDSFLEEYRDEIKAEREAGVDMLDAEKTVLGVNHAQIGARLARRWGLPEVIVDVVENHHTPEKSQVDPKLTAVAHLAESITYALALGEGLDGLAYTLSDSAMGLTGIDHGRFEAIEDVLISELRKAKELVNSV